MDGSTDGRAAGVQVVVLRNSGQRLVATGEGAEVNKGRSERVSGIRGRLWGNERTADSQVVHISCEG